MNGKETSGARCVDATLVLYETNLEKAPGAQKKPSSQFKKIYIFAFLAYNLMLNKNTKQ